MMKIRFYFASLLAMSILGACQDENEVMNDSIGKSEITITAAREEAVGSRTTLTEEFKINWHESDNLSVFLGSAANTKFTIHEGGGTGYATFKGTGDIFITGGTDGNAGAFTNVAYYPYSENITISQGESNYTITTSLPASQTYRSASFGQDSYHMVAVAESNRDYAFTFKNVGSMLMFYVKGTAEITKMELESAANTLAGSCTVTAAYDTDPVLSMTGDVKKITLDCTSEDEDGNKQGVQLSEDESTLFVISVPPISGEAEDLTLTIYDNSYGYMVYTNAKEYSVARNEYYTFGATNAIEYEATAYTQDYVQDEEGNVVIYNANGLKWFRDEVNKGTSFAEKTIKLAADIDLNNEEWTPITVKNNGDLKGATFDGQGHTISNYKVTTAENTTNAGLFGYVISATLKNFTIDNAQILYPENYTGDFYGSAVLGCGYCMTLEGITVENSTIQGNNKVGGLMARHCENAKLSVTDCHVKNSTIETKNETDGGNVGGLIGYIDLGGAETNVITNSSVTGCTINAVNSSNSGKRGNSQFVGGVSSTKAAKLTITGCTVENNTYNEKETTYVSPFDGVFVGGERNDNKLCTVIINGTEYPVKPVTMNGEKYYTIAEALKAISGTDAVEITLGEGTFEWPNTEINNTLTVKGTDKEKSIVVVNGISNPNIINFEDLTMTRTPESTYATVQFNHAVQENYTNCIINGCVRIVVSESATFKNCTFYNTVKDGFNGYSIHYYSYTGSTLNVTDCTFKTVSKAICAYNEGKIEMNMNITNCNFTANTKDDKAAIQMHTEKGIYGTLNVTNCKATGFADVNNGLWNELKNDGSNTLTDNFLKTIDGKVYVQTQAGLQAAINAGKEEIIITKSVTATERISIPSGKKITIKGASKDVKYTGSVKVTGELHLSDLTLSIDQAMADNLESSEVSQYSKSIIALVNEGDVYCENVTFDYSLADATAITAWWSTGTGANISVKNCTFNCNGQRPIRSDACVTAENCTFNDPYRYAVQMTSKASTMDANASAFVNFKNNTINAGTSSNKTVVYGVQLEGETYGCSNLTINGEGNKIDLGTTGKEGTMYYCECGKVDHATIVWNTEVAPVHGGAKVTVTDGVQQIGEDLYLLSNANGMKWLKEKVNNGEALANAVIVLTADIDLSNEEWTPIGQTGTSYGATNYFQGVFDGQGYTIKNLKISRTNTGASYAAGLFGFIDAAGATIRNLTVDGAEVKGHHWTGVIAGYLSGIMENCHVKNAKVECTHAGTDACGDKAGAVIGQINGTQGSAKKCTASNSTVTASRDAGQVVGAAIPAQVSDCSATYVNVGKDTTTDCTHEKAGQNIRNEVIGREL